MKKYSLIGEITDFDYHGFYGDYCSPRSLKAWLNTLSDGEKAVIEINSPGGNVIQGVEMANAIKNSKATIVAHVIGIAASMASVIACACDEIEMEEASFMMIHDPWGYAEGNAEAFRKQAGVLDQMKAVIMSFYRAKFERSEDEIAALMADETWYTGAECRENGLKCTVVASDVRAAASLVGHKFSKIPEGAAKFLRAPEMTDEGRAEIEKAKAECSTENAAQEGKSAGDWEARYKGASKKINELQSKVEELQGAAVSTAEALAAKDAAIKDFEDQVKASGFENLAALVSAASASRAELEKTAQDLAECREQLGHMKETRDLLTGSVLSPGGAKSKYSTFAEAVDALGYVAACRQCPELRKSYRAKK